MASLTNDIQIGFLCDFPEHIRAISKWQYTEWHDFFIDPIYNFQSLEDLVKDNTDNYLNKDKLPLTLVALYKGELAGTVTIEIHEKWQTIPLYSPYLSALFVDENFRKKGIGHKLIEFVENLVKEMHYSQVYLSTEENRKGIYDNLGYTVLHSNLQEFYKVGSYIMTKKLK